MSETKVPRHAETAGGMPLGVYQRIAVGLLLAMSGATCGAPQAPTRELRLKVGNTERTSLLRLPAGRPTGERVPLVINLHGGGGDAKGQVVTAAMERIADEKGFAVAYPQGLGRSLLGHTFGLWNAGKCCGRSALDGVDDVGFIATLIDRLVSESGIDRARIYATGFSNGAMLSYRLACELSDKIAAIAPVAGQGMFKECAPKRVVPTLHLHGTADPCAPYTGGDADGGCWRKITRMAPAMKILYEPVPEFFASWRKLHGVGGKPRTSYRNGAATCVAHGAGPAEMELCTSQGGGHAWPGGTHGPICDKPGSRRCRKYVEIVGPLSNDVNASRRMLDFFSRFRL